MASSLLKPNRYATKYVSFSLSISVDQETVHVLYSIPLYSVLVNIQCVSLHPPFIISQPSLQLLEKVHAIRLGCCGGEFEDIKAQPFFRPINWAHLEAGKLDPPFRPNVSVWLCVCVCVCFEALSLKWVLLLVFKIQSHWIWRQAEVLQLYNILTTVHAMTKLFVSFCSA